MARGKLLKVGGRKPQKPAKILDIYEISRLLSIARRKGLVRCTNRWKISPKIGKGRPGRRHVPSHAPTPSSAPIFALSKRLFCLVSQRLHRHWLHLVLGRNGVIEDGSHGRSHDGDDPEQSGDSAPYPLEAKSPATNPGLPAARQYSTPAPSTPPTTWATIYGNSGRRS